MLLVVGGIDAVDEVLLALGREVGVEFDHQVFRLDGVGAVDLDLVIALRASGGDSREEHKNGGEK